MVVYVPAATSKYGYLDNPTNFSIVQIHPTNYYIAIYYMHLLHSFTFLQFIYLYAIYLPICNSLIVPVAYPQGKISCFPFRQNHSTSLVPHQIPSIMVSCSCRQDIEDIQIGKDNLVSCHHPCQTYSTGTIYSCSSSITVSPSKSDFKYSSPSTCSISITLLVAKFSL